MIDFVMDDFTNFASFGRTPEKLVNETLEWLHRSGHISGDLLAGAMALPWASRRILAQIIAELLPLDEQQRAAGAVLGAVATFREGERNWMN